MPLYEYSCENCKKTFDVTQGFHDAPLEACPECGEAVKKLMSLGGFSLRGGGWYASDYKKSEKGSTGSNSEG
jgi:putative FmdB family regulatory protein